MLQSRGATLAPGFLFDCDMGRNLDSALALSMLYGLGRGRLIAVGISNSDLDAAKFCDVIGRYYGSGGGLPLGLAEDGPKLENATMLRAPLALLNGEGQPVYKSNIRTTIDTGDPPVIFRNALLTQQDTQAIVVLAGPATNLARMVSWSSGKTVLSQKVRSFVMAAGSFAGAQSDPRIRADVASSRKLLAEWPTPIVAIGVEAGSAVPYPVDSMETDFGPDSNHPLVAAYRASRDSEAKTAATSGIPSQAVLAALYAANPGAEYFRLSPPGTIEVADDGRTAFKESATGNHRYLILDPAQKDAIMQAFVAMATVKPAARTTPGRN
jgi:inosine-uridine nucleoside N-ribohydrolase